MGVVPPPPGVLLLEAVVVDVETESRRGVPSSTMTHWEDDTKRKKSYFWLRYCESDREGCDGRGVRWWTGKLLPITE